MSFARAERRRQQREERKQLHSCSRRCWLPGDLCAFRIAYECGPLQQKTIAELLGVSLRNVVYAEASAKKKIRKLFPELADLLSDD